MHTIRKYENPRERKEILATGVRDIVHAGLFGLENATVPPRLGSRSADTVTSRVLTYIGSGTHGQLDVYTVEGDLSVIAASVLGGYFINSVVPPSDLRAMGEDESNSVLIVESKEVNFSIRLAKDSFVAVSLESSVPVIVAARGVAPSSLRLHRIGDPSTLLQLER